MEGRSERVKGLGGTELMRLWHCLRVDVRSGCSFGNLVRSHGTNVELICSQK